MKMCPNAVPERAADKSWVCEFARESLVCVAYLFGFGSALLDASAVEVEPKLHHEKIIQTKTEITYNCYSILWVGAMIASAILLQGSKNSGMLLLVLGNLAATSLIIDIYGFIGKGSTDNGAV